MFLTQKKEIAFDEIHTFYSGGVPPFGYGDTASESHEQFNNTFQYLYTDCVSFVTASDTSSPIIIGRRGSGKSSLIEAIKLSKEYDLVVTCPQDKIINWIESDKTTHGRSLTVEYYINKCEEFYWESIFKSLLVSNEKKLKKIRSYIKGDSIFNKVYSSISSTDATNTVSLIGVAVKFIADKYIVTFEDAKKEAEYFIDNNNINLIVLLESIEEYKDFIKSRKGRKILSAILLSSTRSFRKYLTINIKCFFPTEYYITSKEYISNWDKVFTHVTPIQWTAEELWILIIRRLVVFDLKISGKAGDKVDFCEYISDKKCIELWYKYFPNYIQNDGNGDFEDTFIYILRHTQMNPRQIIACCNRIEAVYQEKKKQYSLKSKKISLLKKRYNEKIIKTAISRNEHEFAEGILSVFNYTNDSIVKYKEYLKLLHIKTNLYELEVVYKKIKKRNEIKFTFEEFKRLLFSMGIFGRMEDSEYELYDYAIFEPNIHGELIVNKNDTILAHPIFIKQLHFLRNQNRNKPVCSGHAKYVEKTHTL